MSKYGVFSGPNTGIYAPKKNLRILILFTQWIFTHLGTSRISRTLWTTSNLANVPLSERFDFSRPFTLILRVMIAESKECKVFRFTSAKKSVVLRLTCVSMNSLYYFLPTFSTSNRSFLTCSDSSKFDDKPSSFFLSSNGFAHTVIRIVQFTTANSSAFICFCPTSLSLLFFCNKLMLLFKSPNIPAAAWFDRWCG